MTANTVAVIGGGVIGLSVARAVAKRFPATQVLLLERRSRCGMETSSRSSEVIHAGIYYKPGSLKAKMCVKGMHMLYDLCERENIPFRKSGKLLMAWLPEQVEEAHQLLERAKANGTPGIRIVKGRELQRLMWQQDIGTEETNNSSTVALWSPATGVICSHSLVQSLEARAQRQGVHLQCRTQVKAVTRKAVEGSKPQLTLALVEDIDDNQPVSQVATQEITSTVDVDYVINCAGLESARVAAFNDPDCEYRILPRKGVWATPRNGDTCRFPSPLVYPVPVQGGNSLGAHTCWHPRGQLRLGPLDVPVDSICTDQGQYDYRLMEVYRTGLSQALLPLFGGRLEEELQPENLTLDMAGLHPSTAPLGQSSDFIVQYDGRGMINLVGIDSPGLTSCLALGEHTAQLLAQLQ
ncbi:MAG: hypothetical protein MHM6MM_003158 [Cercozoa sp. M6MM]